MFACFDLFNKFKFSMKNKTKKMTKKKVQIIHVLVEKRRIGGRDGGVKRSDILDSSEGKQKAAGEKEEELGGGSLGRRMQPSS